MADSLLDGEVDDGYFAAVVSVAAPVFAALGEFGFEAADDVEEVGAVVGASVKPGGTWPLRWASMRAMRAW
jgi:hypothetical protein